MTSSSDHQGGSTLRRIQPFDSRTLTPAAPPTGAPIFEWIDPRILYVDPTYQRSLGERSVRQIRRIVEGFDWTKFTPPVCAYSENEEGGTVLKIIDGQHTAIAAASNPHVDLIPVMIVDAPDVQRQAQAFIGQNTDRLGVTATQMHIAALAAGDEDAQAMADLCRATGVVVRKSPPSSGSDYGPGETVAVSAIAALLKKEGRAHAEQVLGTLTAAKLAPVKADHIKAVDALLGDPQFGAIDPEALPAHIEATDGSAMKEAKTFAVTHSVPLWKALASVWFQKARKRKGGAGASSAPGQAGAAAWQVRAAQSAGAGRSREALPAASLSGDLARDERAAKGQWRPGNQVIRCQRCDTRFRGGPGARECASCAYGGCDDQAI